MLMNTVAGQDNFRLSTRKTFSVLENGMDNFALKPDFIREICKKGLSFQERSINLLSNKLYHRFFYGSFFRFVKFVNKAG